MMNQFKSILLFLSAIFLSSCESYLDLAPDDLLDEEQVFSSYESARGYLDNCIAILHCNPLSKAAQSGGNNNNGSGHLYASISDEAACCNLNPRFASGFNTGEWLGNSDLQEVGYSKDNLGTAKGMIIPNALYGIRVANKTIEKVPAMISLTENQKNELLGQAYFFRAWYYFEVIRRWGGMPLFDVAYTTDATYDLKRLSYSESTAWLISDLNKAIELLPDSWDEVNIGRPDKASAYGVRGMAALYAASPLMNNPVGTIENNGYNTEWLESAAKYSYEAIDYVRSQGRDMSGLGLTDSAAIADNYRNIFYHDKATGQLTSDDALFFANTVGQNRDGVNLNIGVNADISRMFLNKRFSYRGGGFGVGFSSPTQNIIEKYEVIKDGVAYTVADAQSLGFYDINEHAFDNRDPRFYNNILIPGGARSIPNGGPNWFEPWQGGDDYAAPGNENEAVGGYMCKKWWWDNYTKNTASTHCYNHAFIRVSQLYLDYAEAMNELVGPNATRDNCPMTAVEAINLVRQRAGMIIVNPDYTTSANQFRERIRDERAVELFWEGHRWFDIRRWMIMEDVFKGANPIRILRTTDNTDYTALGLSRDMVLPKDKNLTYAVEECTYEPRSFGKRNYWYPIFRDHMDRLSVMQQNPGW